MARKNERRLLTGFMGGRNSSKPAGKNNQTGHGVKKKKSLLDNSISRSLTKTNSHERITNIIESELRSRTRETTPHPNTLVYAGFSLVESEFLDCFIGREPLRYDLSRIPADQQISAYIIIDSFFELSGQNILRVPSIYTSSHRGGPEIIPDIVTLISTISNYFKTFQIREADNCNQLITKKEYSAREYNPSTLLITEYYKSLFSDKELIEKTNICSDVYDLKKLLFIDINLNLYLSRTKKQRVISRIDENISHAAILSSRYLTITGGIQNGRIR